jgi:ribosome assembly protein 3
VPQAPKALNDAEIQAAFTKYYMQRATAEFAEDLDKIRGAEDFKDDALPLLISALQQGTSMYSIKEQRRIVMAGMEKEKKGPGE